MPTVEEQVGDLQTAITDLTAEVIAERTARQSSVEAAETAEGGAVAAQVGAETALTDTITEAANAAQSASVATAAAAALAGTEGIIPTASEVLWLASKSQAGVNALGFFDTGARLLSGVSERALLRYGEDNDTLNFLLLDGGVDGVRLDFTADGAVFANGDFAVAGDSVAVALDQAQGLTLGADVLAGVDFTDGTGLTVTNTDGTHIVTFGASGMRYQSDTVSPVLTVSTGAVFEAGKWYQIEVDTAAYVSGQVKTDSLTFGRVLSSKAGTTTIIAKASSIALAITRNSADVDLTISRMSAREILGIHSGQGNAALQGKFGKAPKVVRNLATNTKWADAVGGSTGTAPAGWSIGFGAGAQTSLVGSPDETGSQAIRFDADAGERIFYGQTHNLVAGNTYKLSCEVESVSGGTAVAITFEGGSATGTVTRVSDVTETGRATAEYVCTGSGTKEIRFGLGCTGSLSATAHITLKQPQLEIGATPTDYQAVGASDLDVTESGVQSFGFYRPDLSDDVLPLTIPAMTGDILIAGKKGTWIEAAAPGAGAFSVGPTTYPGGTTNILRVVGDITGVELIDKTLSAEERARLVEYYKARGAKGLLVPGPTPIPNGDFSSNDLTGWIDSSTGTGSVDASTGAAVLTTVDQSNRAILDKSITTVANTRYVLSVAFSGAPASTMAVFLGTVQGNSSLLNATSLANGRHLFSFTALGSVTWLRAFGTFTAGTVTLDDVSLLRPEEDW